MKSRKKLSFEEYKNEDTCCQLIINQEGIEYLKGIVESVADFKWLDTWEQIEALSSSDEGFDDEGFLNLEIPSIFTKTGTPCTYELNFNDHFNCWESEL